MYIESIELNNYERMSLNNIKRFYYEPTKSETIIGGNGSGKTSLLERLSPYIDKKDFNNGGMKIHFNHRNNNYLLSFLNNKYSFIKNGVELNNGHTMKVQNNLIIEHIGLTPMINDVFLNRKTFVNMSVKDRKEWLTLISPSDYEYVLKVYQNVKVKLRDKQGIKREYDNRLKKIESNLKTEEEYKQLVKYINGLRTDIEELYTKKHNVEEKDNVIELSKNLIANIQKLLNKRRPYTEPAVLEEKLNMITHNINRLEKDIKDININNLTTTREIETGIQNIDDNIFTLNVLGIPETHIEPIYKYISHNLDRLRKILSDYFNFKTEFTQSELNFIRNTIKIKDDILRYSDSELKKIDVRLEELKKRKDKDNITCPNCKHTFKDGYDKQTEIYLRNKWESLSNTIEKLTKESNTLKDRLKEIEAFINVRNVLNDFVLNNEHLSNFITKEYYESLTQLIGHLDSIKELTRLYTRKVKLNRELEIAKSVDDELKLKAKENLTKFNLELSKLYRKKNLIFRNISYAKNQYNLCIRIQKMYDELQRVIDKYEEFKNNKLKLLVNQYYDKTIKLIKDDLQQAEEKRRLLDNDYIIYKGMKLEVEKVNTEIVDLIKIERALSPNKGLIAKSIIGFLNVFIEHVNKIINTTWSYDMRVLVPEVTESDLDYKFPVYVEGKIRDDISLTSTGMKAIINLAFKLASMSFLKMNDFPIYLDEFGSSFDVEHRRKTIELIKQIQDNYPQVFIISHYDDVLYSLNNNVINLSSDNVEISKNKKFNSNVEIS